jgi:cathepsin A (carboxypeptidase C)
MGWVDTWMNDPKNKAALGARPELTFQSCNMEVNQAFALHGDGMHNAAKLLPDLINDGIRLLVYAGNAGTSIYFETSLAYLSNYVGCVRYDVQLHCV